MALDTKYRPHHFTDVLGQDVSVQVLRQFVRVGGGFHQSYLFCGPHGCGKTTLGRILARALLCENPQDGDPCDECPSCRDILEKGASECFAEMDAATKSGKADIIRITEELAYTTFSGKRRIYLFDESHRLSKQARDALLKPMEDSVSIGSDDKQLICIFCTTEPENMQSTVFSRCAPAFTIRIVPPDKIAERMAYICDEEGIEYEPDALETIAAVKESHIRDALKAIEALATLGPITNASVRSFLQVDANDAFIKILAYLGSDLAAAMREADQLVQVMSPLTCYERLTQTALLAYRVDIGAVKAPSYWNATALKRLANHHKDFLVVFAQCFAVRPSRPTAAMLSLDLARLHQTRSGASLPTPSTPPAPNSTPPNGTRVPPNGTSTAPSETSAAAAGTVDPLPSERSAQPGTTPQSSWETPSGRYIDPRGVKKRKIREQPQETAAHIAGPGEFRDALFKRVAELRVDGGQHGPTGQSQLGGVGTHPIR